MTDSDISLDEIIKELKTDYNLDQHDIRHAFTNADNIVYFLAYMTKVPIDDYKTRGALMQHYYPIYFNNIADEAYLCKRRCEKQNKQYRGRIDVVKLDMEWKNEIIDAFGAENFPQDNVWAFKTLYNIFSHKEPDNDGNILTEGTDD